MIHVVVDNFEFPFCRLFFISFRFAYRRKKARPPCIMQRRYARKNRWQTGLRPGLSPASVSMLRVSLLLICKLCLLYRKHALVSSRRMEPPAPGVAGSSRKSCKKLFFCEKTPPAFPVRSLSGLPSPPEARLRLPVFAFPFSFFLRRHAAEAFFCVCCAEIGLFL